MLLTTDTDLLSVITEQAGDVDVLVTYIDRDTATGAVGAANRQATNITTVTTTTIVNPPVTGTQRKIESITIRNAHASTSVDVRLQQDPNGNGTALYEFHAARLYPTEMLQWSEHKGFEHVRRRNIPLYETRISEGTTRVTHAVSGSDVNLGAVYNTHVNIKPSKDNNLERTFASFAAFASLSAANTTGIAIGLSCPNPGFSIGRNCQIMTGTNSVTDAIKENSVSSVDSLVAVGTAATGTLLLGLVAGVVKWQEPQSGLSFSAYLGVQSEVGASQVTVDKGTWFELFEHTG